MSNLWAKLPALPLGARGGGGATLGGPGRSGGGPSRSGPGGGGRPSRGKGLSPGAGLAPWGGRPANSSTKARKASRSPRSHCMLGSWAARRSTKPRKRVRCSSSRACR
ncbi:hypothetical protein EXZ61_01705 [Rhodoferax aquaticus]|uniref:Uncharacterized protein n=1 Tax=Rhodoferax aquaticus TaxID=2527691 RepID=A0A515EK09_9BURK|nr:hypothetical protein EXZ61_01705 [Rhodoferax aquaticus]